MRKVPIQMLSPEMVLAKSVCRGTSILINAGTRDLDRYVNRLQALGISQLYIEDAACEGIDIEDLISDRTRLECKKSLEKSFMQIKSRFTMDLGKICEIAESLMDEIMSHPNILVSLNDIGGIGDNTLDHSLNTTIYAICLASQLNYSRSQMRELAQGTLLHDIGKTLLDSRILFKPDKLTEEEFAHIKQHSELGYDMLNKNKNLTEASRQIALSHHERMDGTGYPYGLKGDELSEYTRITGIVDIYEALTVDRCYHKAITPQRAIEILTQEATTKLDFQLTSIFIKNIAIYPNGTTVLLSTGQYAIVKEQNISLPLRPIVRVVRMERGMCIPVNEIDLMTTLNITILDSEISLPNK